MSVTRRRSLTVESFEDRVLPSASFYSLSAWGEPAARVSAMSSSTPAGSGQAAPASSSAETVVIRIRIGYDSWLILQFTTGSPTASMRPVSASPAGSGGTTTPQTLRGANTTEGTFQAEEQVRSTRAASEARPAAVSLGVAVGLAGTGPAGLAPVPAAPQQAQAGAQAGASQVLARPVAAQAMPGRASYAFIEGTDVFEGVDVPVPGPTPRVVEPVPEVPPADGESEPGPSLPTPNLVPTAGVLPLNLAALQASATNFLGRVADLADDLEAEAPDYADYLWPAAAVLLAGGAIQAARACRLTRVPHGPAGIDSALAEWEGRHDRPAC